MRRVEGNEGTKRSLCLQIFIEAKEGVFILFFNLAVMQLPDISIL